MADFRAAARKINNPRASCSTSAKYKGLECASNGHRSQPERAPKAKAGTI